MLSVDPAKFCHPEFMADQNRANAFFLIVSGKRSSVLWYHSHHMKKSEETCIASTMPPLAVSGRRKIACSAIRISRQTLQRLALAPPIEKIRIRIIDRGSSSSVARSWRKFHRPQLHQLLGCESGKGRSNTPFTKLKLR